MTESSWATNQVFITGVLRDQDIGYLISRNKESGEEVPAGFNVRVWYANDWLDGGSAGWECVATTILAGDSPQMFVVGPFGQVLAMGSGDVHTEHISSAVRSPSSKAMIRNIAFVDDHVYAVGMQRSVYRRGASREWHWFGPTHNVGEGEVRGFESIDGLSSSDIYAVGWEGEIWHYNGLEWIQNESPTNLILNSVLCVDKNTTYVCGQCGVLLRGSAQCWDVVDHSHTDQDFWDMVWFNEKLYISTMKSLFCFDGESLEPVDVGFQYPVTFYHLTAVDGVLWSIGSRDVIAFNGNEWKRIASVGD